MAKRRASSRRSPDGSKLLFDSLDPAQKSDLELLARAMFASAAALATRQRGHGGAIAAKSSTVPAITCSLAASPTLDLGEGAAAPVGRAREGLPLALASRAVASAVVERVEVLLQTRVGGDGAAYRRRSEGDLALDPFHRSDLLDGLSFAPDAPGVGTRVLARADLTDRWPALAAVSPSRFVADAEFGLLGCERRRTIGHCGGEPGEGTPSGYSGTIL